MIEELTFRRQTPTPPMDWLYHDEPDGNRIFKKEVYLGKNAEPWPECTDEEKVQWEEEHEEVTLIANEGCWLWRDHAEDVKREFYPSVSIPASDEPLWHECTDQQRRDWEEQHPEPEPEEPQDNE